MEEKLIREEFEELLDEKIVEFLEAIRKNNQTSWRKKNKAYNSVFPMFNPGSLEFFEYQNHERVLEWFIRDLLINDVLFGGLELRARIAESLGEPHPELDNSGISGMDANFDIAVFEERNITEFILQYTTQKEEVVVVVDEEVVLKEDTYERIGYRYCLPESCNESYIRSLLEARNLDRIVIIDFSEPNAADSKHSIPNLFPFAKEKVSFITIKSFFEKFIGENLYKTYLGKVQKTVREANNIIGFQTIPELSLANVSAFKIKFLDTIAPFNYKETAFKLQDGTILNNVTISKHDYDLLKKQFISEGLFRSLVGNQGFGVCFFTSEYLYRVFKSSNNRNDNNFDYTAVVCGYLKSVEQLLYKIMKIFLQDGVNTGVFIKSNKPELPASIPEYDKPHPSGKAQHIAFKSEYEEYFDIAMKPLIHFVHEHPNTWNVSSNGRKKIHKILLKYTDDCRNDLLHKHNIDSFAEVERIRKNTFLCLFYLLGGIKFPGDSETYRSALGIYDDKYDRLYLKITTLPELQQKFFILSYGGQDIKAVYDRRRQTDQYDENGHIISTLRFIKVSDFNVVDNYFEFISHEYGEDEILISRDNIPSEVKYMKQDGQFQSIL